MQALRRKWYHRLLYRCLLLLSIPKGIELLKSKGLRLYIAVAMSSCFIILMFANAMVLYNNENTMGHREK